VGEANRLSYFEGLAIEERPRMARRWDAKTWKYFFAGPKTTFPGLFRSDRL